jgi:hypothetical protein
VPRDPGLGATPVDVRSYAGLCAPTGFDSPGRRFARTWPSAALAIGDHRKIDNLADLLVTEEGPGILAWLVDGARRYLAGDRDLTGPKRVRIATSAYAET